MLAAASLSSPPTPRLSSASVVCTLAVPRSHAHHPLTPLFTSPSRPVMLTSKLVALLSCFALACVLLASASEPSVDVAKHQSQELAVSSPIPPDSPLIPPDDRGRFFEYPLGWWANTVWLELLLGPLKVRRAKPV